MVGNTATHWGSRPSGVVFDFDGTLADSNAIKRGAYFDIFTRWDPAGGVVENVLRSEPDADRFGIIGAVLEALNEAGIPKVPQRGEESIRRLAEAYNTICEDGAACCPEMPGAGACLQALRPRCLLFVNSATPTLSLRRVIKARGWSEFFHAVLGRPESKEANLEWIAREWSLEPDRLVMVGDGLADQRAARHFGCRFVGTGEFPSDSLDPADRFAKLEALPALLGLDGAASNSRHA